MLFIDKAMIIHKNKYDYSKVIYINAKTKVEIICPIHGSFFQIPTNHIKGSGCSGCKQDKIQITKPHNINEVLKKFQKTHGDKYDYSKVKYTNSQTKVEIICPLHGSFFQLPSKHAFGQGCYECGLISNKTIQTGTKKSISSKRLTNEEFILRSTKIHNNKYEYSITNYQTLKDYVKIICKDHGVFHQIAGKHLLGRGCPNCKKSKQY